MVKNCSNVFTVTLYSNKFSLLLTVPPLQLSLMGVPCINVVAVGDAGCGKTCLLSVFMKKGFLVEHTPVNIDHQIVYIEYAGNPVAIRLYSTAGKTHVRSEICLSSYLTGNS